MFNFLNTKIVSEQLKRLEVVTPVPEATNNEFPVFVSKGNTRKLNTRDTSLDLLNNRDNYIYFNIDHEFNQKFENILLKTTDEGYFNKFIDKIKAYIVNKDYLNDNVEEETKAKVQVKVSKYGHIAFVKGRMLLLWRNDHCRLYNITDLKGVEWHPIVDRLAVITNNHVYVYDINQWSLNARYSYNGIKQFSWDSSGE